MRSDDPRAPWSSGEVSRRTFLRGVGAGGLLSLWGVGGAAGETLPPPRFLLEWGRRGKGKGEFSAPVGIAIGANDEVYVSEFRNQRVQKFTAEGRFLGEFAVATSPGGVAVDPKGNVYVAYWNSHRVAAYSPAGKPLREWGRKGSGDGEFLMPGSIAYGPDGLIYVPDQGNSRVQQFTNDGKYLRGIGGRGTEPGRFRLPHGIALDSRGFLHVVDTMNARIQKFAVA